MALPRLSHRRFIVCDQHGIRLSVRGTSAISGATIGAGPAVCTVDRHLYLPSVGVAPTVRSGAALPQRQQPRVNDEIRVQTIRRKRRPSAHADYELRLGDVRVFYRVRDELVEVVLIGKKRGDRLLIGGKEFEI